MPGSRGRRAGASTFHPLSTPCQVQILAAISKPLLDALMLVIIIIGQEDQRELIWGMPAPSMPWAKSARSMTMPWQCLCPQSCIDTSVLRGERGKGGTKFVAIVAASSVEPFRSCIKDLALYRPDFDTTQSQLEHLSAHISIQIKLQECKSQACKIQLYSRH